MDECGDASLTVLTFSLQCWKQRNLMVHGANKQEQQRIALQTAREKIKRIYADPSELALSIHLRSLFGTTPQKVLTICRALAIYDCASGKGDGTYF